MSDSCGSGNNSKSLNNPNKVFHNSNQIAKEMSQIALNKIKVMRHALRSSPTATRAALALDLLILLKELPAGFISRVHAVAATLSFTDPTTPTKTTTTSLPSSSSKSSSSSTSTPSSTEHLAAPPSSGPPNDKDKGPKKSQFPKCVLVTPLGTPVNSMDIQKVTATVAVASVIVESPSVLKNIIEINSQNNRVIESRMLSEFTREQLLSSSQEEQVSSSLSSTVPKAEKGFESIEPTKNDGTAKSTTKVATASKFIETNIYWQNVESRTKHLVALVAKACGSPLSSKHNLITHLDELFGHIYQHSDTRLTAVDAGGIKVLIKVMRMNDADEYILNKTKEILGLLGNNPPTKGHGIKLLSIDGGGVRGLVALEVLRALERITGKRIYELFDYICGVSTGSILAFLLGAHKKSLEEAEILYKDLSREIFSQNSFLGSAALLWSHSYYHTPTFEKILKKHCGEQPLITLARDTSLPRVSAISTIVNQERVCPYVFRTYALPPTQRARYMGGCRYHMWEAVRASAAAPTYFEEIKLGNYLHQDGGVLCNNPTSVAISEARTIWKDQPLQCVVSVGTGLMLSSRTDKNLSDLIEVGKEGLTSLSWKGKFLKVLDSATDTESVHNTLNELLPHSIYFRLNPYLSEVVRLDEASPEKLERVQLETRAYLERNFEKVQFVCKTLLKEKGIGKKVADWWYYPS